MIAVSSRPDSGARSSSVIPLRYPGRNAARPATAGAPGGVIPRGESMLGFFFGSRRHPEAAHTCVRGGEVGDALACGASARIGRGGSSPPSDTERKAPVIDRGLFSFGL